MKLNFERLELECNVLAPATGKGAYEDWLKLSVRVRAPGFEGQFTWEVMVGEIDRFLEELEEANSRIGTAIVVTLEPVEPNVKLRFSFNELGQIEGEYRFRAGPSFEPSLTGSFRADQSYVPGIVASFKSLLHEARAGG